MAEAQRYRAFISYSHQDQSWARWLHRSLEGYRLPRRLAGSGRGEAAVPRRLTPIFRDRDDLPAASDLSASVREALGRSDALIVICSPAAAASPWVNEEIRVFRELNPDRPVLAAIIDGEPEAAAAGTADACFPPVLLRPAEGETVREPVGADFRPGGDGRRLGLLKLISGLLDLKLDQLIQRDAQRRQRRVTAITVISLAFSLVLMALTFFAVSAQSEAERRKAEAEDLIEFMLSDLRIKLEPVGRLDVLDAVGAKVIDYYDAQNDRQMMPDDLGRRARAFHLMGRIDSAAGDMEGAYEHFVTAYQATERIYQVEPSSPARIYEHAQSAFWVGFFALGRNDLETAEARLGQYRDLSQQLLDRDPDNLEYRTEVAYAQANLGAVYTRQGNWEAAYRTKRAALQSLLSLAEAQDSAQAWSEVADAYGWVALTAEHVGRVDEAIEALRAQIALYEAGLMGEQNWTIRRDSMAADYALARLLIAAGPDTRPEQLEAALEILEVASVEAEALVQHDPSNMEWRLVAVRQRLWLAEALLLDGQAGRARDAYLDATGFMSHSAWEGMDGPRFAETRLHAMLVEARLFAALGEPGSARETLQHLMVQIERSGVWARSSSKGPSVYAGAALLMADLLEADGEFEAARDMLEQLVEHLAPVESDLGAGASHLFHQALERVAAE
ncbi:TIR domain-containing protein [Maricaulis sp. CAU 1757]